MSYAAELEEIQREYLANRDSIDDLPLGTVVVTLSGADRRRVGGQSRVPLVPATTSTDPGPTVSRNRPIAEVIRQAARLSRPRTDMTRAAERWARRSPAPEVLSEAEERWASGPTSVRTRIPRRPPTTPTTPRVIEEVASLATETPEERASREAVRELEEVVAEQGATQSRRDDPEGRAITPPVETPRPSTLNVLDVESTPTGPLEWDREANDLEVTVMFGDLPALDAPRPRLRGPNGRRRRYNPRRHLEMDDFVSVVRASSSSRSPSPVMVPSRTQPQTTPPSGSLSSRVITADPGSPNPIPESAGRRRSRSRQDRRTNRTSRGSGPRLEGSQFGGLNPIETDPTVDPPPKCCFNCWSPHHRRVACPEPPRRFCYNCGRRGTDLVDCPRCRDAHRRHLQRQHSGSYRDPSAPAYPRRVRFEEEEARYSRATPYPRGTEVSSRRPEAPPPSNDAPPPDYATAIAEGASTTRGRRRRSRWEDTPATVDLGTTDAARRSAAFNEAIDIIGRLAANPDAKDLVRTALGIMYE